MLLDSEEERRAHDKIASLEVRPAVSAARMPLSSPIAQWALRALGSICDRDGMHPVRLRMMGATAPTGVIAEKLALPFVIVPLVNPDNAQHSYDENLRVGNCVTGIRVVLSLLRTPYP